MHRRCTSSLLTSFFRQYMQVDACFHFSSLTTSLSTQLLAFEKSENVASYHCLRVLRNANHVDSQSCDYYSLKLLRIPEQRTHANEYIKDDQVNSTSYENTVRRYLGSHDLQDAERLHLCLIKSGYEGERFLTNNLINIYAKVGDLRTARQVFDGMTNKNAVSWTCLTSGYVQRGLLSDAFDLFRSMVCSGFMPTEFTLSAALQACKECGSDLLLFGKLLHSLIWKAGYIFDSLVASALMLMYGSCSLSPVDDALKLFHEIPKANLETWNSAISLCSTNGDMTSVFMLYSVMLRTDSGLKPNEYTFSSLTKATYHCPTPMSALFGLNLVLQLFTQVLKSGYLSGLYVGSALVSAFSRHGLLDVAKGIFLQMTNRNAASMNGLMVGLVKRRNGEEALEIFHKNSEFAMANDDCYAILLSACAEFNLPGEGRRKGREIHGLVTRLELTDYCTAVGNGLINMYAKCGFVADAYMVFKVLKAKDQVSWNSIISGFDQNGHFEDALVHFCDMQKCGMMLSHFALISSLSSCSGLEFLRLGEQLHSCVMKSGRNVDISICNALLTLYGECGSISECWKVFNDMPCQDSVSWNCLIGALADSGASVSDVIAMLLKMLHQVGLPSRVTFVNIFSVLSSVSSLCLGNQVHTMALKHGLSQDSFVENALISFYSKCGEMDSCENIFSNMHERRDDISWNSMISGYIHNGLFVKSVGLMWSMICNEQKMDFYTISSFLSACASLAALERGMEMHAFVIKSSVGSDLVVDSSLVDMYSKCGRVDYASTVFNSMPFKNEFSWNSMISGYARHGQAKKALEIFKEMQRSGEQPNHITYVGVLSACSHVGLVKEGLHHFESMTDKYGIVPRLEHFSCMIDMYSRAGKLDKVQELIDKIPVKPNALIWRTILGACCRVKSGLGSDLGKQAGKMLLELEPQNPVNYVLLSHMYASRGKWEDVAATRVSMEGVPLRKEAGCSWVTLQDGVHVFVSGDKSHPETENIYAKLQDLIPRIRDAGYVPQIDSALFDLEPENKEEHLSYHSEKIAVAFVLSRTSGLPIRIMKNLRVCGDCHSALCYTSKVVRRQIILRDSNRFHHFNNGKCSCGDYW